MTSSFSLVLTSNTTARTGAAARCHRAFAGTMLAALVLSTGAAVAQTEITVKNDSLPDNPTGVQQFGLRAYFNFQEEVNVWLTAPCNGTIVAVQVMWRSPSGTAQQFVEQSITLYEPGAFPQRSNTALINNFGGPNQPAFLEGPLMTDGGLNEFRFLDENNTVPLHVTVAQGQTFVVSFEFGENHSDAHDKNPSATDIPTIPIDIDGCSGPQRNGILAIPGGWLDWCEITSFCFPPPPPPAQCTGDFIVRVKMICNPINGACCLPNGSCVNGVTQTQCSNQSGAWQGADTTCSGVTCPQPTGACCVNGNCSVQTQADCTAAGGTYRGNGTTCSSNSCFGACCLPGGCSFTSLNNCNLGGGTFQGAGVQCADVVCNPMGACCLESGTCLAGPMSPADCTAQGGTFLGHQSSCPSAQCVPPTGACCLAAGCATELTQADCVNVFGGEWAGPNSTCGKFTCPVCFADIQENGQVDVDDLIAVILGWGPCNNCPADIAPAPFGNNQVDVDDLIMVILNWGPCN